MRARNRVITVAAVPLAVVASFSCKAPMPSAEAQWRQGREEAVRSQLLGDAAAKFGGLRFYDFDPACRMRAMLEPERPPQPLTLGASDGSFRPAHRVGRVRLRFPAGEATLAVYQLDDLAAEYPDMLFLPFRDAGAGRETYGAGRYVEVDRLSGGVLAIDFNRAYNPDCAYGIAAQCPITPEENTVPFAVRAGEMTPAGHD